MNISNFISQFAEDKVSQDFYDSVGNKNKHNQLKGIIGSYSSILANNLHSKHPGISLFIMPDKESAAYLMNDLEQIIGETGKRLDKKKVLFS